MVPSLALTWSTLATQYAATTWPLLAPVARTYYAQRGLLVTAANYLAMSSATAAEPFIGNVAASQLISAVLPAAGPADETYAQYVLRGADYAQPLFTRLTAFLQEQAVSLADFTQRMATPESPAYLTTLLDSSFWIPVTADWQQQLQRQLDTQGRWQRLLATQQDPILQALLTDLNTRLAGFYPTGSLNTASELPLNELARVLWTPAPLANEQVVTQLVESLQSAAQVVMAQNYPDAELSTHLVATVAGGLAPLAQLLLLDPEGKPAVTTVAELATAEVDTLAHRLVLLPANHPLVYALAAWVRDALQDFLLAENPPMLTPASLLPIRGQLQGADDQPLADFVLRPVQILDSQEGAARSLGELRTNADGRFALNVSRDLYLDENDAVAEASANLRAAVYYPSQDTAGEPALTLTLATNSEEVAYSTSLLSVAPAPVSQSVAEFSLPTALTELLAEWGIASLADVRAAGGVQQFLTDADDPEVIAAGRRLDGLAQFEVVSPDTAFHELVIAAGFYSLNQLLDTTSPEEFVQRLALADAPAEVRSQAQAFYQQAAATQSLSQTLGLLLAGAQASGTVPTSEPVAVLNDARFQLAAADDSIAEMATATKNSVENQEADAGDSVSAQRLVPGLPVTPAFDPAPAGNSFSYDSSQQCDCPACRSAVSPTAYLAALLKYATTNLRVPNAAAPTVAELQAKFRQPFADLRVSCQAVEESICQYRLAIEVIQSYYYAKGALTVDQARPYLEAVLEALLQALGTSLAELRATATTQLPALAIRLAVPEVTLIDLRTTFSVARLAGSKSLTDLETELERCFGLVSTARDPLSSGVVLSPNVSATKLLRWSLQGVEWGVNTGPEGLLHVEIIRDLAATPQFAVVVYKGSLTPGEEAKIEDNVVARGDLRPFNAPNLAPNTYHYAALLYPQHGSGLSGSVLVQSNAATSPSTTSLTLTAVPAVTAGQQQALFDNWLRQDAATLDLFQAHDSVSWNGYQFIVDPDLLGPDDFRPLVLSAPDLGNQAYRVWRRRYDFLQHQLPTQLLPAGTALTSSSLGTLLDQLTQRQVTYTSVGGIDYKLLVWGTATGAASSPGTTVLTSLHTALAGTPTPASTSLLASLGLPVEGIQRLYDLWQLSLNKELTTSDLQEAVDLVRQSAKKSLEASWVAEETAKDPISLSFDYFQPALHEPRVGAWEQVRTPAFGLAADQLPSLDPDEVTPLDLPDAGLGDVAATLWGARQAELLRKRQAVVASGATAATPTARADAMLAYAYRSNPIVVTTGLPGTPPLATLAQVWNAYQNNADPQHGAAQAYVTTTLGLRSAEAERLLALYTLASTQPTEGLWQELATLLTLGWKRAVAYRQSYVPEGSTAAAPSWLTQEATNFPGTPFDYLISTRKHHLVKWRAAPETRAAWSQVLSLAAERPLIDPDQLVPGDFRQAGERSRVVYTPPVVAADQPYLNSAYDLFARRTAQVQQWLADVQAAWPATTAAQWTYVADLLHSTPIELQELHRQLGAGVDVRVALLRLGLPTAGLDLLVAQIEDPVATDRLPELHHLLVQVRRRRAYAVWALEERALGLNASPQYFRRPSAESESLATLPWRSSTTERRQWQRTLSARFAQADALTAARQQAVRSAEDQYMPLLREALITYKVDPAPVGFDSKADWLNSTFLLDFKAACCQHTTRVAQAIEVLQKLFVNLRGGLPSNEFTLVNTLTTFETDWQWLGSYERWRSLLFLYLYPQNVLLPALKPGQSAQYGQTVQDIRQAATLSPAAARDYMAAYQAYLADMSTLQIGAATETTLAPMSPDGFQAASGTVAISVQTALSASHVAYANIFNLTNPAAETTYNWTRLPGAALVEQVIGSTVYQPQDGERYVYVFVLLREDKKNTLAAVVPVILAFQRLNLRSLQWEADFTQLALKDSETLDASSLRVINGTSETWAPVVVGLRNRRALLYTEYPFSLPVFTPYNGPADAGNLLLLERMLGNSTTHYNVDLFFVVLDAAGKGIGLEQDRTIFCCEDVKLLSGIQAQRNTLTLCTALTVGQDFNSYLSIFRIQLADYGAQVRYLIPGDYAQAGAVSPVNERAPYRFIAGQLFKPYPDYYTSLFRSPLNDIAGVRQNFTSLINNIKAFLDGTDEARRTNKVAIEARAETLYSTQSSGGFFPLPPTTIPLRVPLATKSISTAAGVRVLPSSPLDQTGALDSFGLNVYYRQLNRQNMGNGYRYFYDLYCISFSVTGGGASFQAQLPIPFLSQSSVNLIQPQALSYVGPALRSAPASTATLGTTSVIPTAQVQANDANVSGTLTASGTTYLLSKVLPTLPPLFSSLSATDQASRRKALADIHAATPLGLPSFVSNLVSEAYYALPILLAQELVRSRNYELALHYYRLVYDYTQLAAPATVPDPKRLVYPSLLTSGLATYGQDKVMAWLQNPNNPYTLAALRPDAHLQYVVMSVVRCLLAYADTEFTADTAESVSRARSLYELAARLLKQDITQYAVQDSASLLDPVDALIPAAWLAEWQALKGVLARVNQRNVLEEVLHRAPVVNSTGRGLTGVFTEAQNGNLLWDAAFNQAWLLVNGQLANLQLGYLTLGVAQDAASPTGTLGMPGSPVPAVGTVRPYVPFLATNFCVPTNPVPFALSLQAELNLFKIRSCRNIAGIQRELEPYAAATDNTTGLPTLNGSSQLTRSARLVVPATQYRYAFIIERARQLVALAQQTESTLLSALEKRDAEAYNQLKARQDIAVSQATVQLQTLRVTEAEDNVDLAGLQLEKTEITEAQYDMLLDGGLNEWEIAQMVAIGLAGILSADAATARASNFLGGLFSNGSNTIANALAAAAALAEMTASLTGLQAGYARREQEWQYQRTLARKEIQINKQQIKIAGDQVRIHGQEKRISQLQLDHAQAVLDFLTTKFTNAELYDWMSRILESAYGYFLQQATAMARLAEQQLAFERQQVPAGIVQADYYSDPVDDVNSTSLTTGSTTSTDRKGLTGSVRLLQDLTRLDEYAFETNRRKLQLSKTISLAQSFPTEFVRFRETGMVSFACQSEWFDQDFPGQYLRIVRRVRTSVIALVPPVDGIKARLSTAGTSHVTVDGTPFQTLALSRAQEAVALTSPSNATGLYELDTQNELLLPFEGVGVDVPWQFSMQPASNPSLDYSAVADVLITLDYSALESADYARQVVQQLGTERRQVVALSLRDRFADQWYDLHHADELAPAQQYVSTLTLTADDLPRNLRGASVSQVSLYVDVPLDDAGDPTAPNSAFTDRSHLELRLTRGAGMGGAAFTNQYGLISTRTGTGNGPLYTGNAGALVPLIGTTPAGDWTLTIGPGRLRDRLAAGLVNDIYLILEVAGDVPAYVL